MKFIIRQKILLILETLSNCDKPCFNYIFKVTDLKRVALHLHSHPQIFFRQKRTLKISLELLGFLCVRNTIKEPWSLTMSVEANHVTTNLKLKVTDWFACIGHGFFFKFSMF